MNVKTPSLTKYNHIVQLFIVVFQLRKCHNEDRTVDGGRTKHRTLTVEAEILFFLLKNHDVTNDHYENC